MINLEVVCLGNNGRSPIIEAVFRDEASRMSLEEEADITSSGLYVERPLPLNLQTFTMKKALGMSLDIYGADKAAVEEVLSETEPAERYAQDEEYRQKFDLYFAQAYNILRGLDVNFRQNVLLENELEYTSERAQFPSTDRMDLVLIATKKIVEPAKEMMLAANPDAKTRIISLGEYTGTDDLPGGFGKESIKHYDALLEGIQEVAPIALERMMNEFGG